MFRSFLSVTSNGPDLCDPEADIGYDVAVLAWVLATLGDPLAEHEGDARRGAPAQRCAKGNRACFETSSSIFPKKGCSRECASHAHAATARGRAAGVASWRRGPSQDCVKLWGDGVPLLAKLQLLQCQQAA